MTQYNVHLYREMRLAFAGIEAESPESAALIAREKPTAEADDINDCEGESLAALVDVAGELTGNKPYSVLLLYPDYANDSGTETYYAFVEATDPIAAVALAQQQVVAVNDCLGFDDPDDFHPLLVTQGHHASQPLFNR